MPEVDAVIAWASDASPFEVAAQIKEHARFDAAIFFEPQLAQRARRFPRRHSHSRRPPARLGLGSFQSASGARRAECRLRRRAP